MDKLIVGLMISVLLFPLVFAMPEYNFRNHSVIVAGNVSSSGLEVYRNQTLASGVISEPYLNIRDENNDGCSIEFRGFGFFKIPMLSCQYASGAGNLMGVYDYLAIMNKDGDDNQNLLFGFLNNTGVELGSVRYDSVQKALTFNNSYDNPSIFSTGIRSIGDVNSTTDICIEGGNCLSTISGGGNPFDQSLNTTDQVQFLKIQVGNSTHNLYTNMKRINVAQAFNITFPMIGGSYVNPFTGPDSGMGVNNTLIIYNELSNPELVLGDSTLETVGQTFTLSYNGSLSLATIDKNTLFTGQVNSSQLFNAPSLCLSNDCITNWNEASVWNKTGDNIWAISDVGIGVTTPSESLEVNGGNIKTEGTSAQGLILARNGAEVGRLYTANTRLTLQTSFNNDLAFQNSSGEVFFLIEGDTGDVGIGTTTPSSDLEIVDDTNPTIRIDEGGEGTGYFTLTDTGETQTIITKECTGGTCLIDVNPNPSDGSNGAQFRLFRSVDTTGTPTFRIFNGSNEGNVVHDIVARGTVVFNEIGAPENDFRIEGDTDTNLFYADASADAIGIGESSPAEKLDVAGNILIDDSTNNRRLQMNRGGSEIWRISGDSYDMLLDSNNDIRFDAGSVSNAVFIEENTGRVGISDSTPDYILDVEGNFSVKRQAGTNAVFSQFFSSDEISRIDIREVNDITLDMRNSAGSLVNRLSANGNSYITGGNLGIGTSSPSHTLNVDGDVNFTGDLYTNDMNIKSPNGRIFVNTNTGGTGLLLDGDYGMTLYQTDFKINTRNAGTIKFGNFSEDHVYFETDTGNVGIGQAPSTGYRLHVTEGNTKSDFGNPTMFIGYDDGTDWEGNLKIGSVQLFNSIQDDAANPVDTPYGLVLQVENNPAAAQNYTLFSVRSSGDANRFTALHGAAGYASQFYDSLAVGALGYTQCSSAGAGTVDCGTGSGGDLYVSDDIEADGTIYAASDVCLDSGTCLSTSTSKWNKTGNLIWANADVMIGSAVDSGGALGVNGDIYFHSSSTTTTRTITIPDASNNVNNNIEIKPGLGVDGDDEQPGDLYLTTQNGLCDGLCGEQGGDIILTTGEGDGLSSGGMIHNKLGQGGKFIVDTKARLGGGLDGYIQLNATDINLFGGVWHNSTCGVPFATYQYERGSASSNQALAVGNGDALQGLVACDSGVVESIAASCENCAASTTEIAVELRINGVSQTCDSAQLTSAYDTSIVECSVTFAKGDRIGCYTKTETGAVTGVMCSLAVRFG